MTISFLNALELLRREAPSKATTQTLSTETVPVANAVGRIAAAPCLSPRATPVHSTSAMDGFLLCSSATSQATPGFPAIFTVAGIIIPGQSEPKSFEAPWRSGSMCMEVMTGGQFPGGNGDFKDLDACVPVERVSITTCVDSKTGRCTKSIAVTQPVAAGAHRRLSGTDITAGQPLLLAGQRILSSHLLPLLSAEIESVPVVVRPRVGIWSTGNEFVSDTSNAPTDINGPYLMALCREFDAEPVFLGYLDDKKQDLVREFETAAETGRFHILITTGAVSAGKFDLVRPALTSCGADILFHGVNIRPGHPVLFASLPSNDRAQPVIFFGLPGNPGATAACFRFLVVPILRQMQLEDPERPIIAKATRPQADDHQPSIHQDGAVFSSRGRNDCFVPGRLAHTTDGCNVVEVCSEVCPAKLGPFIQANCWVHVYPSYSLLNGDMVECYPLSLMAP